jgi:hypothetical protein
MTVPETAMHEDDRPEPRQDYVRPAWQFADMRPIAQAVGMEEVPDCKLGLGITASDARHHATSDGRRDDVRHLNAKSP